VPKVTYQPAAVSASVTLTCKPLSSVSSPALPIAVAAYASRVRPVGYLLVRIFRRQDIRSVGSGNIAPTNVLRFRRISLGIITFLLDVLKGSARLAGRVLGAGSCLRSRRATRKPSSLFAVLGHMFTAGCIFMAQRRGHRLWRLPCRFTLGRAGRHRVFAVTFALSRYVSVGSIVACMLL